MESCPRCGVQNQVGRAACWNCFGPLEGAAAAASAQVPVVRAPRFAIRIPWKPIVGIIALAALAYGGLKFVKGMSPASVAASYLDAVMVGDTERQSRLTREGTGAVPLLEKQFKLKKAEVLPGGSISDTTAEVQATLTIEPSTDNITAEGAADLVAAMRSLKEPVIATISLTREGRAWKVDQDATARRLKTQIEKKLTPELAEKLGRVSAPAVPAAPSAPAPTPGAAPPAAAPPVAAPAPAIVPPPAALPGAPPPATGPVGDE